LMFFLSTLGLLSPAIAAPTTQRAPAANGWNASVFDYARADDIVVERTTPTAAQVNFHSRPPQNAERPAELNDQAVAKPVTIGPVDVVRLRFGGAEDEMVTALLCTPKGKSGPFPLVIAVHGLGSNKAQVVGQVAPALAKQGFAVLAPDMPLHGERAGWPHALWENKDFIGAIRRHRQAVINVRQTIDLAETLPEVDVSRGVIFVGYSMGGPVAQLIWRRHRHLVDGLVLCATAADFTSPHLDERLLRAMDEMWRAAGPIRRSAQIGKQVVSQLLEVAPVSNQLLEALARHDDDALHGAGLAIGRFCSTEWVTGVDVPVVVLVTSRDRLVRPAQQWHLAALTQARTITVDAVHFAPFRQPELIAGAVTASCDSITQPTVRSRFRRAARLARRRLRSIVHVRS